MKPMMAQPLEMGLKKHESAWRRIEEDDYIMEPKLDGMRLLLSFGTKGQLLAAFTRSGRDVADRIPQAWIDRVPEMPPMTVLDCEFGYRDIGPAGDLLIDFNKTMRIMGSGPEVAQAKAEELLPELPTAFVFDILMCQDERITHWAQHRRADVLASWRWPWYGLTLVKPMNGWDYNVYSTYVTLGGEGVMLKNPNAQYLEGKRPTQAWYKVKKFATIDVVITGFQEGQGKYTGQVGAVKFSLWNGVNLEEVGQCSGMDDATRQLISAAQGAMMGKVMEIRHFGYTAGTPRHPQFVRLREDKTYLDCSISQISDD
jgi:ATP-dependent DNA ligase